MGESRPTDVLDELSSDALRTRLDSLQALLARAPVPIAVAHDPDCRVITANRALASLLRVPPDTNISMTPPDGEPPYRIQRKGVDIPTAELPMQYAMSHRMPVSNEIEIVRADGSVLFVQNDVEPLYDPRGDVYGCVSVCVDITDRKLSEIALRDADRRKDEFLATLSHELRNPLAAIRTAIEVMRLARQDPELAERARATTERQLLQLVRITDDLLDVSRITQNKIELRRERLDLRSVLQSAIEATRPTIDANEHTLITALPEEPLWIDGDSTRLVQALANILNNAAKYTSRGGEIRVSADTDGTTSTITIRDNGVGIPRSMLPRIFDMFTQLQAYRDRTHGGLGIGLALAKQLVELHGGAIDATSEGHGLGSSFTVRLPVTEGPGADAEPPQAEELEQCTECRVLVAEDNADAAEMMRVMLGFSGHDVRVAPDGVAAVALAESFDPHIAFLDIGMPRMDGYEAAWRIRRLLGQRVVLVALTGWGQEEDKRQSAEAGFDHHLTKPPEPEVLERLIAESAERRASL